MSAMVILRYSISFSDSAINYTYPFNYQESNMIPDETLNMVLAGDIGGTKTRLAAIEFRDLQIKVVHEIEFQSGNYATFEALLREFFLSLEHVLGASSVLSNIRFNYAVLGIAGPVKGRVVQTTNLPWNIDADEIQLQFAIKHCALINDLEATAYGLPALCENDLLTLQTGVSDVSGNVAVIAAGTGLGEAGLCWDGSKYVPFATEGGHTSFSPGNEIEVGLLRYLQQQYQHVSWERVVSGMGLLSIYEYICQYRHTDSPQWLQEEMCKGDAAAAISTAALSRRDECCIETLSLFVSLYAAEAGNLALKLMSRGGLYLGGGIAPKILPLLQDAGFLDAFLNKGRMRPLLEAMPVKVILNDRTALLGAALRASQLSVEMA
jgi:glucokinase